MDLGDIPYFRTQPMALIALEELLKDCIITNVTLPIHLDSDENMTPT